MPKNITQYSLLLSCPGDVTAEREIAEQVVKQFNHLYSSTIGISLLLKYWGTDVFPESGGKPQDLINNQLVDSCDAAIAIFWTRFGSPTDKYGSGTEEEIERMLQSGRQVFLYFSDKPLSPSEHDSEGYQKIIEFRKRYSGKGIYWLYSSDDQFKDLLFAHLTSFFLGKAKLDAYQNQNRPELRLLGIDQNGNLSDNASLYQFALNSELSIEEYRTQIIQLLSEISEMNVAKKAEPQYKPQFALDLLSKNQFSNPVSIPEDDRKIIEEVVKCFSYSIPDDFFELGNLSENTLQRGILGSGALTGSKIEKEKYKKINELSDIIRNTLEWFPVENAFVGKQCIRLALQNSGKKYDEDVEVSIELPIDAFESIDEIAHFDNDIMEYLLTKCDISSLFGISSTADYLDYDASRPDLSAPNPIPTGVLNYTPDYTEAFNRELEDVFCYSVYKKKDKYVVKLKVNYIKHNTTVAFPSVLFLKRRINSIPYRITSKNLPDVIEGTLNCENT